ncbi:MAG: hypothetical protein HYV42_00005 [Candidatus Magasanikbacteria bacterium]|nr:hypothetical protein [Candidatus Magasanikbacteria bacterium]
MQYVLLGLVALVAVALAGRWVWPAVKQFFVKQWENALFHHLDPWQVARSSIDYLFVMLVIEFVTLVTAVYYVVPHYWDRTIGRWSMVVWNLAPIAAAIIITPLLAPYIARRGMHRLWYKLTGTDFHAIAFELQILDAALAIHNCVGQASKELKNAFYRLREIAIALGGKPRFKHIRDYVDHADEIRTDAEGVMQ